MISPEEITARQARDLAKQRSIVAGFYTMSARSFYRKGAVCCLRAFRRKGRKEETSEVR
jgi:hypothetical protein